VDTTLITPIKSIVHSGTLADVLDSFGVWGAIPSELRRVSGDARVFFGEAYTVSWRLVRKKNDIKEPQPSTWRQVEGFLAREVKNGSGKIYVAGCDHGYVKEMALAGGLSATHFQNIGFEAIVLGGSIRDAHTLSKLDIPVVATGFSPADTQGCYRVHETGTSCSIGGVTIHSGDWLFGDATGVVAVPRSIAAKVMDIAIAIEKREERILEQLALGMSLHELVEKDGRI
jgi:regulator of RNase E activity RraA